MWLQFRPRAMGAEISHVVSGMTGQNDRNTLLLPFESEACPNDKSGSEPRFFCPGSPLYRFRGLDNL